MCSFYYRLFMLPGPKEKDQRLHFSRISYEQKDILLAAILGMVYASCFCFIFNGNICVSL